MNFNFSRRLRWRPKRKNPPGDEAQRVGNNDISLTGNSTVAQNPTKSQPCWRKKSSTTYILSWNKSLGISLISGGVRHEPAQVVAGRRSSVWTVSRRPWLKILGGCLYPSPLGKGV